MKRRVMSLAAIIIAVSMILTACGGAKEKTGTAETTAQTTTATGEAAETTVAGDGRAMDGNLYLEGLPLVKEQETFSIFMDNANADFTLREWFEKQTNVKVDWKLFPYDVAKEKKTILLSSGDYPDVIGGWLLSENDIQTYSANGIFVPLDEAFKKYSPVITSLLDMKGIRDIMTLPNGHVYTVPYVLKAPAVPFNPFINKKWLEAVGMQMPTTTDELINVLKAFKDKDPNGNGKKDEIPFSGDLHNGFLGLYAGWWGMPCPKSLFTMVDGKLTFAADSESFKSAIKFFNQLNSEGLFDPEFFTQTSDMWKAKGQKNLYGVSLGYGSGDFASELFTDKNDGSTTPFAPVPVLKGTGTDKPVWQRNTYGSDVLRTQFAVTDKAKNVPTIVRFFDFVLQEDTTVQINNGPLDITIKKIGDHKYQKIDQSNFSEADKKKYEWGNLFPQAFVHFSPFEQQILEASGGTPAYDEKAAVDKLYEPCLNDRLPLKWVADKDAKRLSILETDIQKYVQDQVARWVVAKPGTVDAEWEGYKTQLKKLGVEELIQIKTQ